jgi:hypothetical protein
MLSWNLVAGRGRGFNAVHYPVLFIRIVRNELDKLGAAINKEIVNLIYKEGHYRRMAQERIKSFTGGTPDYLDKRVNEFLEKDVKPGGLIDIKYEMVYLGKEQQVPIFLCMAHILYSSK